MKVKGNHYRSVVVVFALILLAGFGQSAAHAQTTTTNLGIAKPQAGQAQPSVTIATGFDNFDAAIAGRLSKSVAGSSDVTLTATEARNAILEFTGVLTGSINVIVPSLNRTYLVYNATSGSFTLTVKTSAGTGVAVNQTDRVWIYCDGTNVVATTVASGGANTTLSNLSTTAINTALLPGSSGKDLGAAATAWRELFFYGAGTYGSTSIKFTGTPTGDRVITVPDRTATMATTSGTLTNGRCVEFDASGNLVDAASAAPCGSGGGSGATTALDNLASVSINSALLFQTGIDTGSTTKPTKDVYLYGSGTYGSTYLKLTGTPTSTRTVTFPDASITVAGIAVAQAFSNKTLDNSNTFSGFFDQTRIAAPANPSAGSLRLYSDNATGKLACLDSAGADCMPSAGSAAWSSLSAPSGNLSLAMSTNVTAFTWAGNFTTSSAFKLEGNNTSATGPLLHLKTNSSNLIPPLLVEVRGANARLKVGHLGDVLVGQAAIGSTDTDGFPYLPVVGSNAFPTSTPTGQTGMAPVAVLSNGINGEYDLLLYANSKWNSVGGARKRYDTASGTGAQTLDFNSNAGGVVTREFTATGTSAAATLTFNNPPPAGSMVVITIIQGGGGSNTVTWPASVKWSGGTAPTLTTTVAKRDTFVFMWNGSNYYNTSQQLNQ